MRSIHRLLLPSVVFLTFACGFASKTETTSDPLIKPSSENPFYWQYQGDPLMLIGASADEKAYRVRWIDVNRGEVVRDTVVNKRDRMLLSPPSPQVKWIAVIRE